MSGRWEIIGGSGLQFYGKMTASISHEIKNAMAIINENAGLLEDYNLMAGQGIPLDPDRLNKLAGSVKKQIRRIDGIIKNMNRFAHSVDDPVKNVNLDEVLELSVQLAARFAAMKGISLKTLFDKRPLAFTTAPFLLENLVWLCLDYAMDNVSSQKALYLAAKKTSQDVQIRFGPLSMATKAPQRPFPTDREKALADELRGELRIDMEVGEIVIIFPKEMQ